MKYKIRFHLGRGVNYRKWQVFSLTTDVKYYDPDKVCIIMKDCKLINKENPAKKIYEGANKSVCSWIECTDVEIDHRAIFRSSAIEVSYNPKVIPYWELNGDNVDGYEFTQLFTVNNSIRISKDL